MTVRADSPADVGRRELTAKGTTTRDRIVAAARSMLLERGYDGLVLRELAESLDIKLGNLQYYFKTREALALHVLKLEGSRDADLVEEQRQTSEPIAAFRMVVRDMADRYRGDSGRLLLMITSLAQHHGSFLKLYHESYANFYPAFEALIHDLRPGLSADEIATRARIVNALVEGSSFQTEVGDVESFLARIVTESELIVMRASASSGH